MREPSEAEIYDNRTKKYQRVAMRMYRICEKKFEVNKDPNEWNRVLKFMKDFNAKYPCRVEGTFMEELQRL